MTQIDFFSNAPNRNEYVARLLQKIQQRGQRAVVYGTDSTLNQLSEYIWSVQGFLAHELITTSEPQSEPSINAPFILTDHELSHFAHHEVLINLSDEQPPFFAQFERLIEIVPSDAIPKEKARERWQNYKNTGYAMKHHDIANMKK